MDREEQVQPKGWLSAKIGERALGHRTLLGQHELMNALRGYFATRNNASHANGEQARISSRRRSFAFQLGWLVASSAVACGERSSTDHDTQADLGSQARDTSESREHRDESDSSVSAPGASSSSENATSEQTASGDGSSGPIAVSVDGPEGFSDCTELRKTTENKCRHVLECEGAPEETSASSGGPVEVECLATGDASLLCSCRDASGSRSYRVEGVSVEDGCGVMRNWCEVTPSDTLSCPVRQDGNRCAAECGYEIETGLPKARAWLLSNAVLSDCSKYQPDGDWICLCENSALSINLASTVSSSSTAQFACAGAVNTCLVEDAFEPEGAPDCTLGELNETASSCNTSATCSQPGRVEEYSVALRTAGIGAQCELTEDERWQCLCTSLGPWKGTFDLDAAASRDACTDAYQTCVAAARYVHDDLLPSYAFTFEEDGDPEE